MQDLPDVETFLREQSIEMYLRPPPKTRHHLGYLIEVRDNGDTSWGELWTEEPLESNDQISAWATELSEQIVSPSSLLALGFTYHIPNLVLVLWKITKQRCTGEIKHVINGEPRGAWMPQPLPDKFATTLWQLLF